MPVNESKIAQCLIVDDEPMARDVLRRYLAKLPYLHLAGECSNAIDAFAFLQANHVDLIFLDIRMPELLGTELVQSLRNPPKVIFTTAYKEYALDGFELDAVDYLLKPVRFERFLRAVDKAFPGKSNEIDALETGTDDKKPVQKFIYLRIDRKLVKILLSDILYIESDRDYVKVFTVEKRLVTRQTISSIEAMLSDNEFVRIHRSFVVNIQRIKSFNHEIVEIGTKELPVGKLFRNNFIQVMRT